MNQGNLCMTSRAKQGNTVPMYVLISLVLVNQCGSTHIAYETSLNPHMLFWRGLYDDIYVCQSLFSCICNTFWGTIHEGFIKLFHLSYNAYYSKTTINAHLVCIQAEKQFRSKITNSNLNRGV